MDYLKVKELLAAKGKTQKEMCNEIGILEQSLSGIKSGSKKAGLEMVIKIANYLKIHPKELAPEYSDYFVFSNEPERVEVLTDNVDYHGLMEITQNLSFANKELSTSTKELAASSREATSALIEIAKKIMKIDN